MEKISVIIPIYNVEKYLNKCVESVVNQTYKNLEIILVDDGSPDKCPQICEEWAKKDNRIKVIHKQNGGLSDARNYGINKSSGDYLIFIDSDDYISLDCIEILYNSLKNNNSKISVARYINVMDGIVVDNLTFSKKTYEFSIVDYWNNYFEAILDKKYDVSSPYIIACCKLFKKELFDQIEFPLGKINEDEFTTYKVIDKCDKIIFVDQPLYYYLRRTGSIMNSLSFEKSLDSIEAFWDRHTCFVSDEKYNPIIEKSYIFTLESLIEKYFKAKYDLKSDKLTEIVRQKYLELFDKLSNEKKYNSLSCVRRIEFKVFKYNEYVYRIIRKIRKLIYK